MEVKLEECRQKAQHWRTQADRATDPKIRAEMLSIANEYEQLALNLEYLNGNTAGTSH